MICEKLCLNQTEVEREGKKKKGNLFNYRCKKKKKIFFSIVL